MSVSITLRIWLTVATIVLIFTVLVMYVVPSQQEKYFYKRHTTVNKPELKSESAGTSSYKPGREYIAIPQNEIDANPVFKQNPGY